MGGDKYWPEAIQLASLVSGNHSNVKGMSDRVILRQYSSCEMARNRVVIQKSNHGQSFEMNGQFTECNYL